MANLSLLSPSIPGPEAFLAGRPLVVVTLIALQIVVTLLLTGVLARGPVPTRRRDHGWLDDQRSGETVANRTTEAN
jgi:hypothetical protein